MAVFGRDRVVFARALMPEGWVLDIEVFGRPNPMDEGGRPAFGPTLVAKLLVEACRECGAAVDGCLICEGE